MPVRDADSPENQTDSGADSSISDGDFRFQIGRSFSLSTENGISDLKFEI